MNDKIKNKVIVIGGEHYNALGVIRSLGELGINPYFVLIANDHISPCSSSKYIKETFKIESESYTDVYKFLMNNFNDEEEKPILIPTGDPVEKFLDSNYNELSKKYILPNIDNRQGEILKCMDKNYQHELCEKFNVNVPNTWLIDLNNKSDIDKKFPKKVIVKPDVSADGKKSDILILEGESAIKEGLMEFKKKDYSKVLVQEFIEYDMEYAMMGIACNDIVIIPGINSNDYIYPNKRGNTSYAEMFPLEEFELDVNPIINMIKNLKYTGLFEVELFKKGDKLYFNEMNFRNSANLYAYSGNNIPYIYLYINLLLNNDISEIKQKVDKHYFFCVEPAHLKNVKEGLLGFREWARHVKNSTKLIYNKKDKKPFYKRIQNSLYLRLTNQLNK